MGRNRVVRFDSAEFNEHTKAEDDADAEENAGSVSSGSAGSSFSPEGRS
jgi:hypothetical protein